MEGVFCCSVQLTKHPKAEEGYYMSCSSIINQEPVFKNDVEESIYRLKKKKALKQLERNKKSSYYKDNGSNN